MRWHKIDTAEIDAGNYLVLTCSCGSVDAGHPDGEPDPEQMLDWDDSDWWDDVRCKACGAAMDTWRWESDRAHS